MGRIGFLNSLNKNKGTKYIFYQILLIICFATLYFLADAGMIMYPNFSQKIGLGSVQQVDTFYSYLYFSIITQTTVGYGGILSDGGNIIRSNSLLVKILNITQLVTIIITTGWTLI